MKLRRLSHTPTITQDIATRQAEDQMRLHGRALVLGRSAWFVTASAMLVLVIFSIPLVFQQLQVACIPGHICPLPDWRLSMEKVQQLHTIGLSPTFYAIYVLALLYSNFLAWFMLAVIIFWRRSNDRVALLIAFFLVTFGGDAILKLSYPANTSPTAHLAWTATVGLFIGIGEYSSDPLLCLFPDGRFVPRWTRMLLVGDLLAYLSAVYCTFFLPEWRSIPSYVALIASVTCLGAQVYRYMRVSTLVQRQQMKWAVCGFFMVYVGNVGIAPLFNAMGSSSSILMLISFTCVTLCMLTVPFTLWIAISRSHLWNIDSIINRTIVYGTLTACVIGTYVLVVSMFSFLFQAQNNLFVSLCATGLVALLFQPLRERLQRGVNRLMYGERDTPYALLSHLGKRIETTLATETILPVITETVGQALKLPYVAIVLKEAHTGTVVASSGTPQETLVRLPLVYQNLPVGEMLLAHRAPDEPLTGADLRLLNDIARQTSVVAHAVRLSLDLQRSRERLVMTREEERRRLHRDLHDGLGSVLAGLSLKIGAAHNQLTPGQTIVETLLTEVSRDIEQAIDDIRRIVYDLRPPSLDELGLLGAMRTYTTQYSSHSQQGSLRIMMEAPDSFPPLPAAIEVAAYRIVQEALINVVRHAQAQTCSVLLSLDMGQLQIEVRDDGIGIPQTHRIGFGLIAIRERVEELRGTCEIERTAPQGTRVWVSLPLSKE